MSEHPMNLSSLYRRRALEQLSDDELQSTMMEASAILRQRERRRRDDFRRACARVCPEFFGRYLGGGRPNV